MTSMELFALGLVVVCATGLGFTIVVESVKLLAISGRATQIGSKVESRKAALEELRRQLAAAEEAETRRQAELSRLANDRARVEGLIKSFQADKLEMVHELGQPDGTNALFICELKTTPDFNRIDSRRLIFAREIWQHRNVAHVWAESADAALGHVQRAFHGRSGVVAGRIQPTETAAAEPAGTAAEAPDAARTSAVTASRGVPRQPATERQKPAAA